VKEIILHHDRNRKSFLRHFPDAEWLGFECGYWGPSYLVSDKEWAEKKHLLPKSCSIDEIKTS
jgi:hypothetical protein